MATVRYQVDEVPESAWAEAWFPMPTPSPAAAQNQRWYNIRSTLGAERQPSPRPAGAFSMSPSPAWMPPSSVAPDWFAPQISYVGIRDKQVGPTAAGTGIGYMPHPVAETVPPVVPLGTYGPLGPSQVAMGGRKIGGRRSMHWPRSIVRWPNLRGDYQT